MQKAFGEIATAGKCKYYIHTYESECTHTQENSQTHPKRFHVDADGGRFPGSGFNFRLIKLSIFQFFAPRRITDEYFDVFFQVFFSVTFFISRLATVPRILIAYICIFKLHFYCELLAAYCRYKRSGEKDSLGYWRIPDEISQFWLDCFTFRTFRRFCEKILIVLIIQYWWKKLKFLIKYLIWFSIFEFIYRFN